jgi:hypothetical protein
MRGEHERVTMAEITTQQLAELLIGIARSQQAVVDAIESMQAGFKGKHFSSTLQSTAKLRSMDYVPTLQDLPARVLLQCQGRTGPDLSQLVPVLEAMLAEKRPPIAPAAIPPAIARAVSQKDAAAPEAPPASQLLTDSIPFETTK